MKKITTLLLLFAFSLSTFAVSNEETFSDGTVFYHKPNGNYIYIETTNPNVSNSLYNRTDLVDYQTGVDSTNKKVYVFKLKDYNLSAIHDKVQTFANLSK